MNITAMDSHHKARALQVTGHVKPSGMIVAKVENDRKETYFVTIKVNGETTCGCQGHENHGHCYHVTAVLNQCHTFKTYDELTQDCTSTTMVAPDPNDEPLPPAARLVLLPVKTTTPPRYTLLALQDNRSVVDKIFGNLGAYC